jgi:hypothetical protein
LLKAQHRRKQQDGRMVRMKKLNFSSCYVNSSSHKCFSSRLPLLLARLIVSVV